MLRHLVAVSAIAVCCTAAAFAQTGGAGAPSTAASAASAAQANLPPVDTMTCAQMQTEMTADGQVMSHQLDPQFGAEAQSMYNEAQQREREAQAQAPVNALACLIPFVCAAAQQHQQQQAQGEAAQNQQRMQAQMGRLNSSMNGLDQTRMQAISTRWEAQHCQTPH
ncbi:MAG: hypothetical protein QM759_00145 [Terricaulis sp.]